MQPYAQSLVQVKECLKSHALGDRIVNLLSDKTKYAVWKNRLHRGWMGAWKRLGSENTLAIACDHERGTWKDMATNEDVPH